MSALPGDKREAMKKWIKEQECKSVSNFLAWYSSLTEEQKKQEIKEMMDGE